MTAPLPRHFDLAGFDWRNPVRQTWGWAELLPRLRARLDECRRRTGHWSYDLNQQLALAEAVQDGERALNIRETADVG